MSQVYPETGTAANTSWSATVWYSGGNPTGSLPQTGDDVYFNGIHIAPDININVNSLNTIASPDGFAAVGGYLNVTGNLTINCTNSINAGTTSVVQITGNGFTVTVTTATFNASQTSNASAVQIISGSCNWVTNGNCMSYGIGNATGVWHGGTGTGIHNGNLQAGSVNNSFGINNDSTGFITVNGTCTGGGATGANGISNSSLGGIRINGDVYGGTFLNSFGVMNQGGGPADIYGNLFGSSTSFAAANESTITSSSVMTWHAGYTMTPLAGGGLLNNNAQTMIAYSPVIGGTGSGHGIRNNGAGLTQCYNTVTGGVGPAAFGAYNSSTTGTAGVIECYGPIIASTSCPAVSDNVASTGLVYLAGQIQHDLVNGIAASTARLVAIAPSGVSQRIALAGMPPALSGSVTLYAPSASGIDDSGSGGFG